MARSSQHLIWVRSSCMYHSHAAPSKLSGKKLIMKFSSLDHIPILVQYILRCIIGFVLPSNLMNSGILKSLGIVTFGAKQRSLMLIGPYGLGPRSIRKCSCIFSSSSSFNFSRSISFSTSALLSFSDSYPG